MARLVQPNARHAIKAVLLVGLVSLISAPAAAAGMSGWSPTSGHLARTAAHGIGIVGGLVIMYFAEGIRRSTRGSTVAKSALLVEVATGLFALVFVGMEAGHLFGIDVWYFSNTMFVTQVWWMATLAAVLILYTLSYRTLVKEIGV